MEQPSYYAILSANVRYDKNISDKAKLLFADITALSNKYGYCTASNNYFAELFDVKKETISRNISSLEKNGHVKVELIYKGKEVIQRRIYPITQKSIPIDKNINTPIDEKQDTLLTKNSIGIDKNMLTPIDENVKENITSINNTRNNNTSSSSNNDDDFKTVINMYQENIEHNPKPLTFQKIQQDFDDYGKEVMLYAIEKSALKNNHSYSFINYLLNDWKKKQLKTIEAIKQSEHNYEHQKQTSYSKNTPSKELTPKWLIEENNQQNNVDEAELERERKKLKAELDELWEDEKHA